MRRKIIYFIIAIVVVSFLISTLIFALNPYKETDNFFASVSVNDCGYYNAISEYGYNETDIWEVDCFWSFFPLYPIILYILKFYFPFGEVIGVIISNILLLLSLFISAKYILETRGNYKQIVFFVILMTLGFYSLYFKITYTESLYFFLLISIFYLLHKKKYNLACVLGMLLAVTRSTGFLIMVVIFAKYVLEYFSDKKVSFKEIKKFIIYFLKDYKFLIKLSIIPLGVALYMFYLYQITGDPLAWYRGHYAWGREVTNVFTTVEKGLHSFGTNMTDFYYLLWHIFCIYLVIEAYNNKRYLESLMLGLTLMMALISGQLYSFPRILVGSGIGIIIFTDILMKLKKNSAYFLIITSVILEVVFISAWFSMSPIVV